MNVERVPLTDSVKRALQPSLDRSNFKWADVEKWIADGVAAVWRIGAEAWGVTLANADNEIELILGGGRRAIRHAPAFIRAMENLPVHNGWTLRIEGRRGWRRFCKDWAIEKVGSGDVVLTKKVQNGQENYQNQAKQQADLLG